MSAEHPNTKHGGFERRDIGISGVLYFLAILAVICVIAGFLVSALYHYLDKRTEANQPAVSPLVTNAPKDTRKLPVPYPEYLKQNFPSPQLEINERDQLNKIRNEEDETLETYGWIDQKAGTVRIPIDRAMDLIAQRGLPVRTEGAGGTAVAQNESSKNKGTKQ
jgi:hypothetical protein